ncbi:MAG: SDR family NAD(P)-dependent oxidoreductase [Acidimicrobiia bacterium]|nr:SDR family NAD(P)-dependent oxidoreductase [Acidimicrobiia bacterium]
MIADPIFEKALVTGASRGIGAAVVRSLCSRGLEVHALARNDDDLQSVAAETGAQPHKVDVRDVDALRSAIGDLEFDVVVNNAGVLPRVEPFFEHHGDAIDLMVDVNLRAALQVTSLVLPGMIERDRGHIFYLGSIAGRHPTPNLTIYSATKAALHAFAEGLRADLLGSNIRVTVLMPGRVETRLYDGALGGHDAAEQTLYRDFDAVQPHDISAVVNTALDMPPHVDLTTIEVMPTKQVYGGISIAKNI